MALSLYLYVSNALAQCFKVPSWNFAGRSRTIPGQVRWRGWRLWGCTGGWGFGRGWGGGWSDDRSCSCSCREMFYGGRRGGSPEGEPSSPSPSVVRGLANRKGQSLTLTAPNQLVDIYIRTAVDIYKYMRLFDLLHIYLKYCQHTTNITL